MAQTAKKLIARFTQRMQSSMQWAQSNPILAIGEIGIEEDTTKAKVGDGVTSWDELQYLHNPGYNYSAGAGVRIQNGVISMDLLYEILKMPNYRIYTDEGSGVYLCFATSDGYDVYTED